MHAKGWKEFHECQPMLAPKNYPSYTIKSDPSMKAYSMVFLDLDKMSGLYVNVLVILVIEVSKPLE